ncbi:hypothetical protein HYV64_04340 [Candidatus Shapirobacteria bacterium]|nr:hypothetical protein [Candidatus Shapirobacteria bacterium]
MKNFSIDIPDKIFGIDSLNIIIFTPLLVLVILFLLSVNVVFIPKFNELLSMQNNLTDVQGRTQTVLEKTIYIQSIDSTELQKNEDFLSSALMPQNNSYLLVGVIRKVITKFGFQIDSFLINPGKVSDESAKSTLTKGVSKIPIKVVITGPKTSYLDLVKGLEKTLPLLSISSFKMSSLGILVKLDLEISAFYIEDSSLFDINKLTLADLTLKKEETDLVTNLSSFEILEKGEGIIVEPKVEFKKYDRKDPFSL